MQSRQTVCPRPKDLEWPSSAQNRWIPSPFRRRLRRAPARGSSGRSNLQHPLRLLLLRFSNSLNSATKIPRVAQFGTTTLSFEKLGSPLLSQEGTKFRSIRIHSHLHRPPLQFGIADQAFYGENYSNVHCRLQR